MVKISEAPINVVMSNKRKMLLRLGQNGTWSGLGVTQSPGADAAPSAKRRDLTHTVTEVERGNPAASPGDIPMSFMVRPPGKATRKGSRRDDGHRRREQAKAVR